MIIPDLNLLVYAYNPDALAHRQAKLWWEQLLQGGATVGLPWVVVTGFVRLSTTRGVLAQPATVAEALHRVEAWLAEPCITLLNPGSRHFEILKQTLGCTAGGAMTTDAHLAALAIEHRAELHSNDSDFGRFPGLRWTNPLLPP
jgi:toxin-antitoxin system PIN domain toxin